MIHTNSKKYDAQDFMIHKLNFIKQFLFFLCFNK